MVDVSAVALTIVKMELPGLGNTRMLAEELICSEIPTITMELQTEVSEQMLSKTITA